MNEYPNVEIVQPPNNLQGLAVKASDGEMDFSAADSAIDDMAKGFVQRLPGELQRILSALTALIGEPEEESHKMVLFRLVHDLKGPAGTFDYNLISIIGNDLCRFIERPIPMTPRRLKVAGYYVEATNELSTLLSAINDLKGLIAPLARSQNFTPIYLNYRN